MQIGKKLLCLLMVAVILLTVAPLQGVAYVDWDLPVKAAAVTDGDVADRIVVDSGDCGDNVTWLLYDDGELVISGEGEMWDYYYTDSPFYILNTIISVIIEDGVSSVGDCAFFGCSSLTSITLPDSVTGIGGSAFDSCESLTNITLPDNVTDIGNSAFSDCSSLTSITLPDSVTGIGNSTFSYCESLTNITIPDSVISIGDSAFYCCERLAKLTIPDSVASIGEDAFADSERLVVFCSADSYAAIYAEENSIPYVMTDAGDDVNIITEKLGSKFTWKLDKRTGVLEIEGTGDLPSFGDVGTPWEDVYVFEAIISEGITGVANNLSDMDNLKNVRFPSTLISIGDDAFNGCTNLENITIPDCVTIIGESAFSNCDSLESITIPNDVKRMGNYAFRFCDSLASVTIPSTDSFLGWYTFADCPSLSEVIFELDENNKSWVEQISCYIFDESPIKELVLPASISYVGSLPSSIEKLTVYSLDCEFEEDCGITYNTTIYGFVGSTAEAYADEVCATFIDVETVHTHEYKVVEPIFYTCITERCTCGKEILTEHTDENADNYCDTCATVIDESLVPEDEETSTEEFTTEPSTEPVITPGDVEESTTEEPATEPSTEESTTEPTTTEPTTTEPTTAEPTTTEPTTTEPTTTEPTTTEPTTTKPTTKPSTTKPVTTTPSTTAPTVTKPVTPETPEQPTKAEKPAKVKIKSVKSPKKKRIVVTWKKVAGANGYEVLYSTSKKFKKKVTKTVTIKKGTKVKSTIKKLRSKKKYFVKVRAYKTVNGTKLYGKWSKAKTVKVK